MALLTSWVKARWEHTPPRVFPRWDALEILELADRGEKFYCVQSAILLMQCMQALGWQARMLEIHAADGNDHSVIEVWSKDFEKWVVMDPDFNLYYKRDGVPLGALDIHGAWLSGAVADIEMVRGPCPYGFGPTKGADLYHHVYFIWRNDFFSRPDAPVKLVHFTDDETPPQLVADGRLLFADPELFGPHYPYREGKPDYMRPLSLECHAPVDGDVATAWMADDNGKAHFVEFLFDEPRSLAELRITWPRLGDRHVAPRTFTILTSEEGQWRPLINGDLTPEEAAYPIMLPVPAGEFDGIRIECEADAAEMNVGPRFGVAEVELVDR
jgi:hypothetical protein